MISKSVYSENEACREGETAYSSKANRDKGRRGCYSLGGCMAYMIHFWSMRRIRRKIRMENTRAWQESVSCFILSFCQCFEARWG